MKLNKSFLLLLTLTAFPLIEAQKPKKTRLAPVKEEEVMEEKEEKVAGFVPEKVDKEWRKAALNKEIKDVKDSIDELEKQKGKIKDKKGKEYTILELRLMLKNDYLRGLEGLLAVEKGERKMPKMMPPEAFEEEEFMEEKITTTPEEEEEEELEEDED